MRLHSVRANRSSQRHLFCGPENGSFPKNETKHPSDVIRPDLDINLFVRIQTLCSKQQEGMREEK